MKKSVLLLTFCMVTLVLNAQKVYNAVKTSVEGGRWEIVQSEFARRDTYKLDKYKGDVYRYVKTSDNGNIWEKIYRVGQLYEIIDEGKINFQLFIGGHSVQDQFLINIHTGETWCMFKDPDTEEIFLGKIQE